MDKNKIVIIAPVAVTGILMLAVLAAMSSTNQAFAAEKKTEVTISATQNGPTKTEESGTWVLASSAVHSILKAHHIVIDVKNNSKIGNDIPLRNE